MILNSVVHLSLMRPKKPDHCFFISMGPRGTHVTKSCSERLFFFFVFVFPGLWPTNKSCCNWKLVAVHFPSHSTSPAPVPTRTPFHFCTSVSLTSRTALVSVHFQNWFSNFSVDSLNTPDLFTKYFLLVYDNMIMKLVITVTKNPGRVNLETTKIK